LNTRPGRFRRSSACYMILDWLKTDTSYSEEFLTSSREGELEA
jgi:hypothetical protein